MLITAIIKPPMLDDMRDTLSKLGVTGDDRADDAVQTIARTGEIGDGKLFVSTIEQAIRIRTREAGEEAL